MVQLLRSKHGSAIRMSLICLIEIQMIFKFCHRTTDRIECVHRHHMRMFNANKYAIWLQRINQNRCLCSPIKGRKKNDRNKIKPKPWNTTTQELIDGLHYNWWHPTAETTVEIETKSTYNASKIERQQQQQVTKPNPNSLNVNQLLFPHSQI